MPTLNQLAEKDLNVEVVWRAFELRPEPAPLPDATSEFFTTMWENSIYPLAEQLGVKIKMPTIKPRSRRSHEAVKWAASHGSFEDFSDKLFRAYFEQDKDIGEAEPLLEIAADLNLEVDSLRNALEKKEFLDAVLAEEAEAAKMGLNGVPAFIADRKNGLMGIQSLDNLVQLVESVRS